MLYDFCMSPEQPPIFTFDMLLDAVNHEAVTYQDLLDAGYEFEEVERLSNHLSGLDSGPVTVSTLIEWGNDESYAEIAQRTLPYTLGRLRRES